MRNLGKTLAMSVLLSLVFSASALAGVMPTPVTPPPPPATNGEMHTEGVMQFPIADAPPTAYGEMQTGKDASTLGATGAASEIALHVLRGVLALF